MNIGENIKSLRKKNNLSQADLGKKLGVSIGAISSWEKGRTEPSIDYICKLTSIFGVDFNELITGTPLITTTNGQKRITLTDTE